MLLLDIYNNAAFLSDEEMDMNRIVAIANQCFSVVNSKVGTNLPFFTEENYNTVKYDAVSANWQYRLIEPYMTWAILNNDGAENALLNDHYQRFLDALNDFKNMGLDDIKTTTTDENGNEVPTGYEGNVKKSAKIVHNSYVNPWFGRWN